MNRPPIARVLNGVLIIAVGVYCLVREPSPVAIEAAGLVLVLFGALVLSGVGR